jgi:hypothetical protein
MLSGRLADKSALYGVVHQLEALGLELVEDRSWPSAMRKRPPNLITIG